MIRRANGVKKLSSYGEVLAIGPFRALWAGQICSQLAVNTLLFILALRVYQHSGSNTAVSGLFLAYGIPAVLFGMVAGTAVDHLDKRRILIYCDLARGLLVLALLFVSQNIFLVYGVTFLNAIITQFYVPAEAPTIPKLVPTELIIAANSLFSFTFYSSLAAGSLFAGPLLRWFGPQWIFIVISMLFFLAMWCESRMPSQAAGMYGFSLLFRRSVISIMKRMIRELMGGIRYITQSPVLFDGLLLLTGTQIILALLGTLGPGFADRVLEVDIRDASLLIVGPTVLGILGGALWVGSFGQALHSSRLIQAGIAGVGGILILLSLVVRLDRVPQVAWLFTEVTTLPLVVTLFFLLGVANSLLDVPANSILQQGAQGDMRGRVYGMLTAAVGGVGILPVVIGGILADTIGVGKVIFFLGVVVLSYGVYRMKYNRI